MVKCFALYFKMFMESHLGLMLDQIWDLYIESLMVVIMVILRDSFFESHWYILMLKCLDLMKASN